MILHTKNFVESIGKFIAFVVKTLTKLLMRFCMSNAGSYKNATNI